MVWSCCLLLLSLLALAVSAGTGTQHGPVKLTDPKRKLELRSAPHFLQSRGTFPDPQTNLALNDEQKQLIVDMHNRLRATTSPPAANMEQMEWSDEIAAYAQEWARCGEQWFEHRKGAYKVRNYGENLFVSGSSASINQAFLKRDIFATGLQGWWDEYQYYNYEDMSCDPTQMCGHYTQMAWATSTKIGCGFALDCPDPRAWGSTWNYNFYLVCNYSPPGNYIGEKPYRAAPEESSEETETDGTPKVRTFGGNALGADCDFPFTFAGQSHTGCVSIIGQSRPGCKTEGDKWGFCMTEEESAGDKCVDADYCETYLDTYYNNVCPANAINHKLKSCRASCQLCDCMTPQCQNDGERDGSCGCRCKKGFGGHDCSVCVLKVIGCQNNGKFVEDECKCQCLEGYGGPDCSTKDRSGTFQINGNTVACAQLINVCDCPYWGPGAKENCPAMCGVSIDIHDSLMKAVDAGLPLDITASSTCKDSKVGTEYVGDVSVTNTGRQCQRWNSQTPHSHSNNQAYMFPDLTLGDAANHCRNPDNEPNGPWCYTTDSDKRWEYCDIPLCTRKRDLKEAINDPQGACSSNPCQHGATCEERPPVHYACFCAPGWRGNNCDIKKGIPVVPRLLVHAISDTSLSVSWEPVSCHGCSFRLRHIAMSDDDSQPLPRETDVDDTSVTLSDLQPETEYQLSVRVVQGQNYGPYGRVVTVLMPSSTPSEEKARRSNDPMNEKVKKMLKMLIKQADSKV